jgi:hypothetical protein
MFILPPMISVPIFGFGAGLIVWPWLGPLAAGTIAAALVACVLILLRSAADRTDAAFVWRFLGRSAAIRGARWWPGHLRAKRCSAGQQCH